MTAGSLTLIVSKPPSVSRCTVASLDAMSTLDANVAYFII